MVDGPTGDVTGGCKCGAVRYRGERADAMAFRCHCRDCQRLTGGGHSDMLPLVAESFANSEECAVFEMTGGSGKPTFSGFCPRCGAQLTRQSARMAHLVYVHAGSLDAPELYRPEKSIYADAAQLWDMAVLR